MSKKDILKRVDVLVNEENYDDNLYKDFIKLFRNQGLISTLCFVAFLILSVLLLDKVSKLAILDPSIYVTIMIVCGSVSFLVVGYLQVLLFLNKTINVNELAFYYWFYKFFDLVAFIFQMIAVLGFVIMFMITPAKVGGDSMEPNYHDGDRLLVWHLFYEPKVNDSIIIDTEDCKYQAIRDADFIIKRVVAVSGSRVTFNDGYLYVDGVEIQAVSTEEYQNMLTDFVNGISYYQTNEVIIPEGYLIVLGDNRAISLDSRRIGLVHTSDVLGKSFFRIFPEFSITK